MPVGPEVNPGLVPPGFGDPWLKFCLFQPTLIARRSPLNAPPAFEIDGTVALRPVWGSVLLVDSENLTPKKLCGWVMESALPLPLLSNGGVGLGW